MSANTGRKHSPQGQYNAGKIHGNVKDGVSPGKEADGVDQPFPRKPVSHRRPLNPKRQDPLDVYDFEKITITKQPRGSLSPQGPNSPGVRPQHPRKDSHGETQMAKAIHAKELMLQEKLWSVEEKIRQIIQKDAVAGREEHRRDRGQAETGNSQIKTRLSEQQRRRETMMQERREEDERTRRERRDIDSHREIHQITVHKQDVRGKLHKSRWENAKEQTRRRKGGDEKDDGVSGETGVKLQDGTEKEKERGRNTISMGDKGWTREKKYVERTFKDGLDDERDVLHINQRKSSVERAATDGHRGAGRKPPGEPQLQDQEQLRQDGGSDSGLQLQPCGFCNRKFANERLQKHVQICKKVKQSHRQVFNSYLHRTKGSAIEEFWRTHSRPRSPEVLKKKSQRQNPRSHMRNLHEGRLPAGPSQPKWSK